MLEDAAEKDIRLRDARRYRNRSQEAVDRFGKTSLTVVSNAERKLELRALCEDAPAGFEHLNRSIEVLMLKQDVREVEIIRFFVLVPS